jgi:hypothetical protein
MSHCWLGFSTHPKDPETGQIDHVFRLFSSVTEQMLSWYLNPTFRCKNLMQPSPKLISNIFAKTQPSKRDQISFIMLSSRHKNYPKFSASFLCCISPTIHIPVSYLPRFNALPCFQPTFIRRMSGELPRNQQSCKLL